MSMPAVNQPNFPEIYERELVEPLFRPWAEILLDRTGLSAGDRVLDVACGTGIVARLARARVGGRGRVVGVDVNPQMLAVARAVAPEIEWREGSAESLPVEAGERFDAVLCHQGLQFFPDRPGAVRQMRRVLVPNGRLGVATWRPVDAIPFIQEMQRVAERHVGAIADRRHGFGDGAAIQQLLVDAGFTEVQVETVSHRIRFADRLTFVRLNAMAIVGMSAAAPTLGDEQRAQAVATIAQESSGSLKPYSDGNGIAFELSSIVATARS
jgi:ubiquinone/menaquinone biosynthesis C-methylase UbiE